MDVVHDAGIIDAIASMRRAAMRSSLDMLTFSKGAAAGDARHAPEYYGANAGGATRHARAHRSGGSYSAGTWKLGWNENSWPGER